MTKCSKCPLPAIIYQKYSGMHLCQFHFADDVHRKARETLRQTGLFAHGLQLALAMDGGKGSATMANIIKNLFRGRRDVDLVAIIIDDHGPGTKAARIETERLGLSSRIVDLPSSLLNRESGDSASDPSSFAQKMRMMTSLAQEIGADAIATGHDLDDEATRIFISYLQGDIDGLGDGLQKARPVCPMQGRFPSIQPLRRIPSKEVRLYALQHGLCFSEDRIEDGFHKQARQQLCHFDSLHPGTKYSLLRSLEKLDLKGADRSGILGAKPLSDNEK